MTPVCPACRAAITLDTNVCWRCGLAVRPTCARCGEPLAVGMAACWYCHEVLEDAPVAPQPPPAQRVAPVERDRVVRSTVPPRRRRRSGGRVVVGGLTAALLLTFGLLAIEAFVPRYTSTSPDVSTLEQRSFDDLGFAIGVPSGWDVKEGRRNVSFTSGERVASDATRGFRVTVVDDVAFKDVKRASEKLDRGRFTDHEVLATGRGTRAGRDAYKRVLSTDGLRINQWWVDRGKGSLRLEFWSRLADEEAAAIDSRIVDTLDLR